MNVLNEIRVQNQDPNFKFRVTGFEDGIFYNQFIHVTTIPDHEVKTQGSPQDDAIYSLLTANIKNEPLIITVPPIKDRYFSVAITDAYMENIDYICSRLGHKKGGNWALVGPDWKGTLPKNVKMIRMPGHVFTFLTRIQARDPEVDIKKAVAYQKDFKAQSLSKFLGKIKGDKKEAMEVPPNTDAALDWYNYILKIMKDNRPLERDKHNYLFRAYYSAIGVWTHWCEEAIYCPPLLDDKGERLNGDHEYEITLPKDKLNPAIGFWSSITYKGSDFVPNSYRHYSVGFDKKDPLKKNPDGLVTIRISNEPPKGEVGNWLPSPKGTDFRIIYRMYNPVPEVLTMAGLATYLPPVKRLN